MPQNLWNDSDAPAGEGLEALAYRSRLLGADRALVNVFGGNTSTKSVEVDHVGRSVEVLWVKGSGSDIADITEKGFAGLKLEEVLPTFDRESMTDEVMVAYLDRTVFENGRPRQSIETLLHAFVPAKHVDHTHPDAIISIACSPNGQEIMKEIWGDRAAWVDYIRPGYTLSKQIGEAVRNNPEIECVVMGKHGLVTWGDSSKESYESTLRIIGEAEVYLESKRADLPFGEVLISSLNFGDRQEALGKLLPVLRGAMSRARSMILKLDSSPEVLEFVGAKDAPALSQIGAACPDHLVHTKRVPLFIEWNPAEGIDALLEKAKSGVTNYISEYSAYFEANKSEGDTMANPSPRIVLVPGIGMITAGTDVTSADVSRQLYLRAI